MKKIARGWGGGGSSHVARLNFKMYRVGVYKCLSLIASWGGRLSLVVISFYPLSLLFGPCSLMEFTLAGPHLYMLRQGLKVNYRHRNTNLDLVNT